jgi:hypothetical protein
LEALFVRLIIVLSSGTTQLWCAAQRRYFDVDRYSCDIVEDT